MLAACTSSTPPPDSTGGTGPTDTPVVVDTDPATLTPPPLDEDTTLQAATEIWQLERGRLIIHVGKTGRLARLGHNHLVSSTQLTGKVWITPDTSLRAEVHTSVMDLNVDDPTLRAAYRASTDDASTGSKGKSWAEIYASFPSPKNIADTRANMLGPRVLDAKNHPNLYVTLSADHAPNTEHFGSIEASLTISVRGVQSQAPVSLQWTRDDAEHIAWHTVFKVDHSTLGIKPFSALGGALAVAEEMTLEVSGILERSGTVQIDATSVEH